MSGIAGLVSFEGDHRRHAGLADSMIAAMPNRNTDGISSWGDRHAHLRHAWMNTTGAAEFAVSREGDEPIVLVGDLRLDNRPELIDSLGASARDTDATLALLAFRKWRIECAVHLLGDFAFVVWDANSRELTCVRDHLGVRPLHYHETGNKLYFASDIAPVLLSGVKHVVDDEYVSRVLVGLPPSPRDTPVPGIKRLEAGHILTFGPRGLAVHQYWSPHAIALDEKGSNVEHFQAIFRTAVRDRMKSPAPIGALLSGGLDSSSICSVVSADAQIGATPGIKTLSATFPGQTELDETPYISEVLRKPGLSPSFVEMSPNDSFTQFEQLIAQQDGVPLAAGLTVLQRLYRAAGSQGIRVLLDGHGGDEVVSHGDRRIYQLASQKRWLELWSEMRSAARLHRQPMTMTFLRLFDHYGTGGRASRMLPWLRQKSRSGTRLWEHFLHDEFARRTAVGDRVREHFAMPGKSATDDRAYHLWRMSGALVPHSLETLNRLATNAGLEVRLPFFDRRLVEFCLALPSEDRLNRGWSRYILRRAMEGILPAKVQWRTGKIDFTPNLIRGMAGARSNFEELLADGTPIARFVNVDRVRLAMDRLVAAPDQADPYEAKFLWRTISLAYWLRNAGQLS